MEELQLLVKFYIKKLYYKYVILNLGQRLIFDNEFKKHKKNIENNINLYYMENPTMDLPKGMDYYNLLYSDNVLFSGTTRAVNGLNKFIDDLLPEENNYLESLSRYVRSPKAFNDFFNGGIIREIDDIDYGVKDIVDAFSFLTSLINLEASLEAKAGIGVGGSIAVGEGATVKIAVGGMAEINFDGKLYEKGELTDLDINDPLRYIMQEIAELFELTDKDGRTGIKSALPLIEK